MDAIPRNEQQEETQQFLALPLDASVIEAIEGNAPIHIKELPVKWLAVFRSRGNGFCNAVAEKVKVTETWVVPSVEDPGRLEGKVVCEVEATPDMCNSEGNVHEGVLVFLIDECSTLSMVVANASEGRSTRPGVSCSINSLFHGHARSGTTLRIVNRSLGTGDASNTGRTEIWDKGNHKLIASGTQMTMPPTHHRIL
ncbi:hypothetical protein DFP72DRAFT_591708 [Ephemerocybe angulata]|uniref:Uncharacterized protein n=1 Tax=Ephemerocybe angulata TaxID=980116 RepID=A0A8H6MAF7_9AGAR|nr:hypothetical protein DFP72DRAFT_591708 [Tulosesus angulatus]